MSTKIYDAYEFKGDLDELMSFLGKLRKRFVNEGATFLRQHVTDPAAVTKWEYAEELKKALSSPMYFHDNGIPNVSCSAVVYPYKGRLFVQFFGMQRETRVNSKRLVDYHYQNQTDPWYEHDAWEAKKKGKPKNKAWMKAQAKNYRERRRVWDTIMLNDSRPVHCGLVYEFISPSDHVEMSYKVFELIHNHKAGEPGACELCAKAKADAEAKEVPNEAKP